MGDARRGVKKGGLKVSSSANSDFPVHFASQQRDFGEKGEREKERKWGNGGKQVAFNLGKEMGSRKQG